MSKKRKGRVKKFFILLLLFVLGVTVGFTGYYFIPKLLSNFRVNHEGTIQAKNVSFTVKNSGETPIFFKTFNDMADVNSDEDSWRRLYQNSLLGKFYETPDGKKWEGSFGGKIGNLPVDIRSISENDRVDGLAKYVEMSVPDNPDTTVDESRPDIKTFGIRIKSALDFMGKFYYSDYDPNRVSYSTENPTDFPEGEKAFKSFERMWRFYVSAIRNAGYEVTWEETNVNIANFNKDNINWDEFDKQYALFLSSVDGIHPVNPPVWAYNNFLDQATLETATKSVNTALNVETLNPGESKVFETNQSEVFLKMFSPNPTVGRNLEIGLTDPESSGVSFNVVNQPKHVEIKIKYI